MMDTIQRIIGLVIGVLVTLVLLYFMADVPFDQAIAPLAIGAVAAFFWPIVVGWYLLRRAKHHREDKIQDEVNRQINEQKRG